MSLSALEQKTLIAWEECEVGYGFGFKVVARRSGTPPHLIRRVVRALARKGAVQYQKALYTEDEPRLGAGYVLTDVGAALLGRST